MRQTVAAGLMILAGTGQAQDASVEDFVAANLIATLYHELGHALIDQLGLPVFGQEEDAADVLSVLMIDALFEEEAAVTIALDTAFGFALSSEDETPVFWDVHGPDLQRYYTTLCLFYGANPDAREDVVADMGLPEDRALSCEDEFGLANDSWGPVLDDLAQAAPGKARVELKDSGETAQFTHDVIAEELAALNRDFALPDALRFDVTACGEANAFYDSYNATITICSEYADFLAELTLD